MSDTNKIISYALGTSVGKWFCTFLHEDGTETFSDFFSTYHEAKKAGGDKVNTQ